jgi:hypothetical protein
VREVKAQKDIFVGTVSYCSGRSFVREFAGMGHSSRKGTGSIKAYNYSWEVANAKGGAYIYD